MLIDAVIFNDELDLLRTRLSLLADHVDHFVVAESRVTFSGRPKPLHLTDHPHLFADFADRMTVVEYAVPDSVATAWDREVEARNCLAPVLRQLAPHGVVLLCDADEVPSPEQCANARSLSEIRVIPMVTYYRRAEWRLDRDTPLLVSKAMPVSAMPDDLDAVRWRRDPLPHLAGEPGGHFSYLGHRPETLAGKYASFSHAELDFPEASSPRVLHAADRFVVDHIGLVSSPGRGLLTPVPTEDFSTVQRMLYELRPDWFGTGTRIPPALARHIIAGSIDAVVQQRRPALLAAVRHPAQLLRPRAVRELVAVLHGAVRRWRWDRAAARASETDG